MLSERTNPKCEMTQFINTGVYSAGAEFSVFESRSSNELTSQSALGSGDGQPTLSRFYRSPSSYSDISNDAEAGELETTGNNWDRSPSPVQPSPRSIFFLEHSFSDDDASAAEAGTSIRRADVDASKPNPQASAEFGNLLKMMFRREGPSCAPEDWPAHHGSVGSFVVPKGSFGSDVLPHVSSFG